MSTRSTLLASLLCFLVSFLVGAPAQAAETYDLPKLLVREPKVGEVVREVTSEVEKGRQMIRQGGRVVQDQAESKRQEYARQVEVLSADDEGNATKTRYVYESYERAQGESKQVLEVEGLEILVDQTKDPVRISAKKREIPPFLENKLTDETAQPDVEERTKKLASFLPTEPVEVGATWSRDPVAVAKALGLGHKGIDASSSKVKGTLTPGKAEGMLRVLIKVEITYTTFQGNPCKEPMQVVVVIEAVIPSAADDPAGTMSQKLTMSGVIETQGMEVAIDVEQSSKTEITRAKK
jgi:hypothetical protein